jgi:RND family efflux transporter MFP subunit
MPLVRLEDTRGFRLEVQVDESRARYVTPGSRVPVLLDTTAGTPPREVLGEVTEVARAVDAGARSSLVKIDLPAVDGLRSGTFGRARFSGPARRTLVVPETALRRQGQVTSVFVVDGDRVRLRLVRVGEAADGRAEMIAGLDEGDLVVTNPQPGLADGQPVRPTSTARPAGDGGRR